MFTDNWSSRPELVKREETELITGPESLLDPVGERGSLVGSHMLGQQNSSGRDSTASGDGEEYEYVKTRGVGAS
jgi:hypothetical protein